MFGGQFQFLTAEQAWAGAVPIAGGVSLTGSLGGIAPTAPAHLTTKAYVDTAIASVTGAVSQAAGQAQVSATNAANAAEGAANAATLAVTAKIGKAGGAAALSPDGNLMLGTVEFLGVSSSGLPLLIIDVPDSDPGVANALWSNGGALWLSPGAST
ncbi:hypothetical protein AA101099_1759 [Neoasaia chiangmaiensis NBRC 101099]|nr:hypothetical protein AA101099_1759 [Neoasaia chiangmaiensis NBRC 101099]